MFDNSARFEPVYRRASIKPEVLELSFRYMNPIDYEPPWVNEAEHMAALEAIAELTYPGFDFAFVLNGNEADSYADVVAGIPGDTSNRSGNTIFAHNETIFGHEFAHVMLAQHHYTTIETIGTGLNMPPGESTCLMDRNDNEFCSGCRAALGLPLDVDNSDAIGVAVREVGHRYPY
jgi:hypothetical protein